MLEFYEFAKFMQCNLGTLFIEGLKSDRYMHNMCCV